MCAWHVHCFALVLTKDSTRYSEALDFRSIDQYNMVYGSRIMRRKLEAAGIAHTYEEFRDDHSSVDYRMDISLPLLAKALV